MHGSRSPRAKAGAAERLLDAQVRRELARLEVTPVEDPLTELQQLAGVVLAWKDALAARVNSLTSIRYEAVGAGTEQLRAEVALFERAMDRCITVLSAMARLNLDERLAKISERQAAAVIQAIEAALAHAGVTGPAAVEARQVVARHLQAIDAGPS